MPHNNSPRFVFKTCYREAVKEFGIANVLLSDNNKGTDWAFGIADNAQHIERFALTHSCKFTKYHTTNKCTNCMSFILKSLF